MTREERAMEIIQKAQAAGMEFLCSGVGDYTEVFNAKRAEGYVVGCWYTAINREGRYWIMYGRKRATKSRSEASYNSSTIQEVEYNEAPEKYEDYSNQTVKQLKEICKDRNIKGYAKMNKQSMIDAIIQSIK